MSLLRRDGSFLLFQPRIVPVVGRLNQEYRRAHGDDFGRVLIQGAILFPDAQGRGGRCGVFVISSQISC